MSRTDVSEMGVFKTLRRHWLVALIVFGVCFALGMAGAYVPEKSYRATTTIAVKPATDKAISSAISAANFLIPTWMKTLESGEFREAVRPAVDPAVVNSPITVEADLEDEGTGIIHLTVKSAEPAATAAWSNALAEALVVQENTLPPPVIDPNDPEAEPEQPDQLLELAVLQRATPPTTHFSPQETPLLLGGAVLGFFAAIFAARIAGRLEDERNRTEQIRRRIGVPVVGEIPNVWQWRGRQVALHSLFVGRRPEVLESFKALRVNVELALLDEDSRTVAITSPAAREGKTTVAAALGWSLASAGKDVVMIDADLRRPTLHDRIGEPIAPGLADLGEADGNRLVRLTPFDGLTVLTAGNPQAHPADVVARKLPEALGMIAQEGWYVVIDSPPLLAAEALQVGALAGRVIVVVKARTKIEAIEAAVDRFRSADVKVLGVVLTRTRRPLRRRKGYYYHYDERRPGGGGTPVRRPVPAPQAPATAAADAEPAPEARESEPALVLPRRNREPEATAGAAESTTPADSERDWQAVVKAPRSRSRGSGRN